jgi:hypothetical protein
MAFTPRHPQEEIIVEPSEPQLEGMAETPEEKRERRTPLLTKVADSMDLSVFRLFRNMEHEAPGNRMTNAWLYGWKILDTSEHINGERSANQQLWAVTEYAYEGVPAFRDGTGEQAITLAFEDEGKPVEHEYQAKVVPNPDATLDLELRAKGYEGDLVVIKTSPYDDEQTMVEAYREQDGNRELVSSEVPDADGVQKFQERLHEAFAPFIEKNRARRVEPKRHDLNARKHLVK